MAVTVRMVGHGEGVAIGDDLTVKVEFPRKGGRRAKLIIEEKPRYQIRPLTEAGDSKKRPVRDSSLPEDERE